MIGRAPRAKVFGSGALLWVTAAYHATGASGVGARLEAAEVAPDLAAAVAGLWLFFSWHLVAVGAAAIWAGVSGAAWLRPVLLFCGAVALVDFLMVLRVAGWFAGTLLLLLAALGLLVGGLLWREREAPDA